MSQLDHIFTEHLARWNYHADLLVSNMTKMENNALYAVWIYDELSILLRTYTALSALQEAGAKAETAT